MTGTLGVVARADDGGLGNLTWELCRHLEPHKVLIMDLGELGRSDVRLDRYAGLNVRVFQGLSPDRDARSWLLDGTTTLYSAETWYDDDLTNEARDAGIFRVLHVMPELHQATRHADEIWLPTKYLRDRFPAARIVPVPVALDRFEMKVRSPARHFVHVWAPAMLDRNGTLAVLAALEMVKSAVKVTILGCQTPLHLEGDSPVILDATPRGYPRDYFTIWPDDADVLLLPRRYAGLSMPVQEAAARGMATVMTNVSPQTDWSSVIGIGTRGAPAAMKMAGGSIEVHDPDPIALAQTIDLIAGHDEIAREASYRARAWAESRGWDVWADRYRRLLRLT